MKQKVLIIKIPESQLKQEVTALLKLGDPKKIDSEVITHQAVVNIVRRKEAKTEIIEEEIDLQIGEA